MPPSHSLPRVCLLAVLAIGLACGSLQAGTIVRMSTTLGDITIKLADEVAPGTVANFFSYVNDQDYEGTFFHRSVPEFILQGGGYLIDPTWEPIDTDPAIANEFNLPNVVGTIAMAKIGGNPDSATSQWFFNLADNRANLDFQNGGFTVFGHVVAGINVVNQIAGLDIYNLENRLLPPNFDGLFTAVPLIVQGEDGFYVAVNSVSTIGLWTPDWNNPLNGLDATQDGIVIPHDLLVLIDALNRGGARELDAPFVGPYKIDVDRNGRFDQYDLDPTIAYLTTPIQMNGNLLSSLQTSGPFSLTPEPAGASLAAIAAASLLALGRRGRARRKLQASASA
jgi:cyclophilin family peptidyl-prolyl cis-trans isomerase